MTNKLVELKNVSFSNKDTAILSNISLCVYSSEILTIIGPNGAGKSSLLRVLLGIVKPDAGQVWKLPAISIGYMPQHLQLSKSLPLTVAGFLKLKIKNANQAILMEALSHVGAQSLFDSQVHSLSGGQWQRVLLARAVLGNPQLLVLDEPVQGVDVNGEIEMHNLIKHIASELKAAVILVSHDLHMVMAETNRVICINQHVCCEGLPEQVKKDPQFMALFGDTFFRNIAVYQHHHNHVHTLKGEIKKDE